MGLVLYIYTYLHCMHFTFIFIGVSSVSFFLIERKKRGCGWRGMKWDAIA